MKRSRLILLLALIAILAIISTAIIACDNNPSDNNNPNNNNNTSNNNTTDNNNSSNNNSSNNNSSNNNSSNNNPPDNDDKQFTGLKFEDLTLDYDGTEHEITISGTLPEGASVNYTNNKGTNAGTYNATATVTCKGYKTLELTATLTINKLNYDMSAVSWDYTSAFIYDGTAKNVLLKGALPDGVTVKSYSGNTATDTGTYTANVIFNYDQTNHNAPNVADCVWTINGATITDITLDDLTVDYNGQEHSITVNGTLPTGAEVAYTANKGTNAGTYNATATITCKGYNTLTLKATLKINKINYDMSAAAWDYTQVFTYDGETKTVTLTGLPDGVTVKSYVNNSAINAGTYTATATLNYDETNYNAPHIASCSWTINKADIIAEMPNDTVEYDSLPHCIQVVGNIPAQSTVTYYYNDEQVDDVTEVGEYNVRCVITGGQNFNNKTLTATFKITSTEQRLFSVVTQNGNVYFQNNLDDNKMYKVSGSGIVKVNNDIPNYMIANENNLYYFSKGLLSNVIKNYNGITASQLYSTSGEYLTTDGTCIYYAINNLLFNTDKNGIYKLKLDGTDEAPTRLVADKAEYLTYNNGYIYYSNKSDGGKLYRVSVNSDNAQGTQLRGDKKDEKVAYIITDGANLYFNSTKTAVAGVGIAAAVCKYNIASGNEVKLTTDSGKYLTKVGSYIYYVNNDKITSNLFGDGIYKVSALKSDDSSMPGTKVLSTENNGYSSLTSDGEYLYYYKLSDKHFYRNTDDGSNEVDLMASFEVMEDTSLSGYSQLAQYNGEIYFTNPLDNGCLYKYNPTTRAKYKVLADSVSSIAFYSYEGNNYMYYCTYVLTNYALFRMDLKTGEKVKISSHRYDNFIFEGNKIYCVRVTGGNNDIVSMNLDGTDEQKLYEGKNDSPDTTRLYKIDNTFYFIMNPSIGNRNVSSFTIGAKDKVNLQKAYSFVIVNKKVYYYSNQDKALKVCDMDGKNATTLVSNVDISYMFEANGKIYYSSKSSQNTGVFVYDIAQNKATQISDKAAHGMTMINGKLYFLQSQVSYTNDYPTQSQSYDGHLYCYDGTTITKVA